MRDYFLQLLFMVLGAMLPILFRALYYAGSKFDLFYFIAHNRYRFYVEGLALVVLQSILFFEGREIIDALRAFGVIAPIFSSSVIGFGISWLTVKTIPTDKDVE